MGQVTMKQEYNYDLLKAIKNHGCTLVSAEHEHWGNYFTHYRLIYPDLQGHFEINDRYDYFENLGHGYARHDCRFWISSDYERQDGERLYTIGHEVAQEPEECLVKIEEWASRIKGTDEKWIIAEWHEPVRYCSAWVSDWTLSSGVEIWKPTEGTDGST